MHPEHSAFDSDVGPSLLRENMLEPDWTGSICISKNRDCKRAIRQNFKGFGTTALHVRMGEAIVHVLLGIFKNLAVPVLRGTFHIKDFVKRILPSEEKIVPYCLQPVPTLRIHKASIDIRTIGRSPNGTDGSVLTVKAEEEKHALCVARATTLEPMSETPVLSNTSAGGIVQAGFYKPFEHHYPCMTARGIIDILPRIAFRILSSHASNSLINSAKHQRILITCPPPLEIFDYKNEEHSPYSELQTLPTP